MVVNSCSRRAPWAEEHALLPAARQNSRHRSGRCVAVSVAAGTAALNALTSTNRRPPNRSTTEPEHGEKGEKGAEWEKGELEVLLEADEED